MKNLPEQLVAEFLSDYRGSHTYRRDRIAKLAELSVFEDTQVAEAATRALFASLVEPLADSFEPEAVTIYNRAIAQVIQACRKDARAALLDHELKTRGFRAEESLIVRADRLRNVSPLRLSESDSVQQVIVLSRVTLGADVAITSVIIERMKECFPAADIVLVGGSKAAELFGGDPRVRFTEIGYRRAGTTIERLLAWVDLLHGINELTEGLSQNEYLIVDPDSRLTQLGLLPVGRPELSRRGAEPSAENLPGAEREYLFFPSREYRSGSSYSLSQLTSSWLDTVLGEGANPYPRVSLRNTDITTARNLLGRMNRGSRPIISINFGVGENQLKRIGGEFEKSLVSRLIQRGAAIVLDKGAGDAETARADEVIAEATRIKGAGGQVRVVEFDEQSTPRATESERLDADILVWNGRIGMLAGLIGESDLYIGYDSAGQHIAAALGVKCIDVFAGFGSPRMLDRWRPTGRAETRVVPVDTLSGTVNSSEVVERVLGDAEEMLFAKGKIEN